MEPIQGFKRLSNTSFFFQIVWPSWAFQLYQKTERPHPGICYSSIVLTTNLCFRLGLQKFLSCLLLADATFFSNETKQFFASLSFSVTPADGISSRDILFLIQKRVPKKTRDDYVIFWHVWNFFHLSYSLPYHCYTCLPPSYGIFSSVYSDGTHLPTAVGLFCLKPEQSALPSENYWLVSNPPWFSHVPRWTELMILIFYASKQVSRQDGKQKSKRPNHSNQENPLPNSDLPKKPCLRLAKTPLRRILQKPAYCRVAEILLASTHWPWARRLRPSELGTHLYLLPLAEETGFIPALPLSSSINKTIYNPLTIISPAQS